jgi:hypothetical protein
MAYGEHGFNIGAMARIASMQVPRPMLPRHGRWNEFVSRLRGPEGCHYHAGLWTCFGDLRFTKKILGQMDLDAASIEVSTIYFKDHGGFCDCEVLLNVARAL